MSDQIPFHIQEDIMKRLPVKSLVQFRCVSKAWKSLIDSSEFIAAHSHTQQHLLVSYQDPINNEHYVSYVDDDTFPQQRSTLTLPLSVKQLSLPTVIGTSHGLVCVCGSDPSMKTKMVVLWNPSIRKSIVVAVPNLSNVGFGVCLVTGDPKIVSITQSWDRPLTETVYCWNVMVYTLSTGKWRSLCHNLPSKPVYGPAVTTDMFIYWHFGANQKMIISFDVSNENFQVIDIPDSVASDPLMPLYIFRLRESLAILERKENMYTVWMMEHGVQRSFTKLFTIKTTGFIMGFRKSGVPILQVENGDDDVQYKKLVVFEPNSEHDTVIEISGSRYLFYVNSYIETLLLLGRSDCISY